MNPNPVTDIVGFMTQPGWMIALFWLLLIASLVIANYVLVTIPWQRRFSHVAQWVVRFLVGAMWWLARLMRSEANLLGRLPLPFGLSLVAVVRKAQATPVVKARLAA